MYLRILYLTFVIERSFFPVSSSTPDRLQHSPEAGRPVRPQNAFSGHNFSFKVHLLNRNSTSSSSMAVELLAAAGLEVAISKSLNAIIHVTNKTWRFRSKLTQLQKTITSLKSIFAEIEKRIVELGGTEQETKKFVDQLEVAEALILKCEHIKWNFIKMYTHALKLEALNSSLQSFCQVDVQLVNCMGILDVRRMLNGDSAHRSSHIPLMKGRVIGFDDRVKDLKAMVLKDSAGDECSVVVVSAPGGCGKTTLVTMLCHENDIKAKIGKNIYFATISENPNLKIVIKNLLPKNTAEFINIDDAINQWGSFVGSDQSEKLLILDDVWSYSDVQRFMFNSRGYNILVTSRTAFTQFKNYQLQPLNQQDATELFRHSAFSESGSEHNDIPDVLVDELVKCCKNHPLVLSVIGSMLKGTRIESWRGMLKDLSDEQKSVMDLDKSIQSCLERSLKMFKDKPVMKQCFLDLGLFPEDQKISATMLMDIWVHLYKHGEDGLDTINHLSELSNKTLATLLWEDSPWIDNYCEEKAVMQHDLLRTLAIRLSSQGPLQHRKRLIINANGKELPQLSRTVNARLLSISTDESFSSKWNDIQAPKAEVFVLNFMSKIYTMPQFIQSMESLKILIITNYGYYFSNLQNFPDPRFLSGLTTLRLEHVSISSISSSILELPRLRKLSLTMCKIGNSFNEFIPNKLQTLLEIDIDSCDDLITFPTMLCNLVSLRKLSNTNCHELTSLSEELGNLTNMEVLRLASCTNLVELPESMRNLQKLRVIDVSDCLHLSKLPKHIGEMGSLKTIHMRGCTGLSELPPSVKDLSDLKVVCDVEVLSRWNDLKNVNVELVEPNIYGTFLKIIT